MNLKMIFPAIFLVLVLVACGFQVNPSTPPLATDTDTPLPPIPPTDTTVPTLAFTDTPLPTITDTLVPTITDTLLPTAIPSETPPPPTSAPTPNLTIVPELSLDKLRNAIYYAPYFGQSIKMVNGSYSEGSGATHYTVRLLDVIAYGDINGDTKPDAAVILAEDFGGSGIFESVVAVLNRVAGPYQISHVKLGDRVQIIRAEISRGVIHLNMFVHSPNDPECCPSSEQNQSFWLLGNKLWLMGVTSGPTGVERVITVTSPAYWADVTNPFTVEGTVAISPFENTLNYSIYLLDGEKVNESSLLVTSDGMGTAGTFTRKFNLSSAGITGLVIIQFKDLSAADGSILAMRSAIVNVH